MRRAAAALTGLGLAAACSHRDVAPPEPMRCLDAGQDAGPPPVTVDEGCGPLLPEEVVYADGPLPLREVPVFSEVLGNVVYFDLLWVGHYFVNADDSVACAQLTRYRLDPAAGVIAALGSTCLTDAAAEELLAAARADPAGYYHCRIAGELEVRLAPVSSTQYFDTCDLDSCPPLPPSGPSVPFVFVHDRTTGDLLWSATPGLYHPSTAVCYYWRRPVVLAQPVVSALGCCNLRYPVPNQCAHGCDEWPCGSDGSCHPEVRHVSEDDGFCHAIGTEGP